MSSAAWKRTFMASDVPKYKISLPLLLTKLLFLSLREQVQRSATSSIKWRTQRLANLSGYKLQRIPASDESKGANDRLALSYCHYHHCQRKEGSFFFFLIIGSPPPAPHTLSTMPLKNMISFFEAFECLQTFF